jgi:hypothetical protein
VKHILLCMALLIPAVSAAQGTCEERAMRLQQSYSRPLVETGDAQVVAMEEQLLNILEECVIWDFDSYPKIRALLPAQRPRVVGQLAGEIRTPYLLNDEIIFPVEYLAYLNLVGFLVAHDSYAQDNFFPLERTLMNTPFRIGEVIPLMDPLGPYLEPEAYASLQTYFSDCESDREPNCQNVLKFSLQAMDLFPLLHELSHLALHHTVQEGVNVSDEIAADHRALEALTVISETISNPDPDMQKEIRLVYLLAPLVWLKAEASRSTGPGDIASKRLQAMLAGLDDQSRQTVDSILNSEHSSHNLRKLTLTWKIPPEHLYIDGIQLSPSDLAGKELLLSAQAHSIVALRGDSLAVVQLSSSVQTQTVPLVFQTFENSRASELEALQSARKPIEILLRTSNGELQPRSNDVAMYHWAALHLLHLDSCIKVTDWSVIPPNKRGEVQGWQRSGQFLNGW